MTESPARSRSASDFVGTSSLASLDELRVRSPLSLNRKPPLTSNRVAVVCRDSPRASPCCLQAAQVVRRSRKLLQRGRVVAAAAAVGERLILSHVLGRWRDRHRLHGGLRGMHAAHAVEGWLRRRVGFQPSLPALGLGSMAQLSS